MITEQLHNSDTEIARASALLQAGDVVAFPTETVYGLGAVATSPAAVQKVFAAKGRPSDNPLIVTVADSDQVTDFAVVDHRARQVMSAFWPGPLTVILPLVAGALDAVVTGGLPTVAVRLPANAATRALIRATGHPIVGPSANTSGKPSPTTADHVYHDLSGKIAAILDDGPTEIGLESTVLDLTASVPTILRPGSVTQEALATVLGRSVCDATSSVALAASETPKAPGMKYRHYAPDKRVVMFTPDDWVAVQAQLAADHAILASDRFLTAPIVDTQPTWSLGQTAESASEQLFAGLRHFDDCAAVAVIFAEVLPDTGVGRAYNNRLAKAAANCWFEPFTDT